MGINKGMGKFFGNSGRNKYIIHKIKSIICSGLTLTLKKQLYIEPRTTD